MLQSISHLRANCIPCEQSAGRLSLPAAGTAMARTDGTLGQGGAAVATLRELDAASTVAATRTTGCLHAVDAVAELSIVVPKDRILKRPSFFFFLQ